MPQIYYGSKNVKNNPLNAFKTQDPFIKKTMFIFIALGLASIVITKIVLTLQNHAQTPDMAELTFSASPSSQMITQGEEVTYEVSENSCNTYASSVQINAVYPTDKLQLENVDSNGSPFSNVDENIQQDGIIKLGKSSTDPQTGKQFVAKLTFKALQNTPPTALVTTNGTAVFPPTSYKSILAKTIVGNSVVFDTTGSAETDVFANCVAATNNNTNSLINFLQSFVSLFKQNKSS